MPNLDPICSERSLFSLLIALNIKPRQSSLNLLVLVIYIFLSLHIRVLRWSSHLLLPCLRMMESISDFVMETWVHSVGTDKSGFFSSPCQSQQLHGTRISLGETSAIVQEIKKITHPPKNNGVSEEGYT